MSIARTVNVRVGDCLCSIAEDTGHAWQTLWDLPDNAALRGLRENPNLLVPGDGVVVPALRPKEIPAATGRTHTFVRKGIPNYLHLRVMLLGRPRANEPWVLDVAGVTRRGTTTANGEISVALPPGSGPGKLTVGDGANSTTVTVQIGALAPVDTNDGVRARLRNLGHPAGIESGELSSATRDALRAFQRKVGLHDSGDADDRTRAALVDAHGC